MTRARTFAAALRTTMAALALAGCRGGPARSAALDDVERVRTSATAQEGRQVAPEAYARAERERIFAQEAQASADNIGATLHAQRAIAAYDHARVVARLGRAIIELADAQKSLDDASSQEASLDASRVSLEHDADELEQRVRVAQRGVLSQPTGRAVPEREAAQAVAARSLAMQAHLLCAAGRMVAAEAAGIADAEAEVATLEERLASAPRLAPIDDSARARGHCLDVLTRARRGVADDAADSDALQAELSAAGGWDPSRDERGVMVALRNVFRHGELTASGAAKLNDLGRVAAAHPRVSIQVVVHDAQAAAAIRTTDVGRAESAVQALVRGGAAASRVRAELAGADVPVVDPSDARERERNERLEVVFVGGGR